MANRASIFLSYPGAGMTRDTRLGMYIGTDAAATIWPELLRRALACSPPVWDAPSLLGPHLVTYLATTSPNPQVTISPTLVYPIDYPIIVVDSHTRTVAFARPGEESRTTNWYNHKQFNDYTTQSFGRYPDDRSLARDAESPLGVFHLKRVHIYPQEGEVVGITIIARSRRHAREIAMYTVDMECAKTWASMNSECMYLGSVTDRDAVPRVIGTTYHERDRSL